MMMRAGRFSTDAGRFSTSAAGSTTSAAVAATNAASSSTAQRRRCAQPVPWNKKQVLQARQSLLRACEIFLPRIICGFAAALDAVRFAHHSHRSGLMGKFLMQGYTSACWKLKGAASATTKSQPYRAALLAGNRFPLRRQTPVDQNRVWCIGAAFSVSDMIQTVSTQPARPGAIVVRQSQRNKLKRNLGMIRLVMSQRKKFPLDFCAKEQAVYFFEPGQQIGQLGMALQLPQEFPRKTAASCFEILEAISMVQRVQPHSGREQGLYTFALASMGHIYSVGRRCFHYKPARDGEHHDPGIRKDTLNVALEPTRSRALAPVWWCPQGDLTMQDQVLA
jgi:hypothetical protein